MNQFVVIQRMPCGAARLSSLITLDLISALQTRRALSQMYPPLRFEVASATRSVRLQLAGLPCAAQMPAAPAFNAEPTATAFSPPPAAKKFAGKLGAKFGSGFAAAFLKSLKLWPTV